MARWKHTIVPIRDFNKETRSNSPVLVTHLSKEELRELNQKISHRSGLDRESLIRRVAGGESLSSIERSCNMKTNEIYQWVKKWDLQGINKLKAQEMLGTAPQPKNETVSSPVKVDKPKLASSVTPPLVELGMSQGEAIEYVRSLNFDNETILNFTAERKWKNSTIIDQEKMEPIYQISLMKLSNALQFGWEIVLTKEEVLKKSYRLDFGLIHELSSDQAYRLGIKHACQTLGYDFKWL